MKVLVLHSRYSDVAPSGENATVSAQVEARREAGMDVTFVEVSTDRLRNVEGELRYHARSAALTAGMSNRPLTRLIEADDPDVIHFHNLFPNIGAGFLRELSETPIIATLHNYRYACARGTLYRAGQICTSCTRTHSTSSIRHKCYQSSLLASSLAWAAGAFDLRRNALSRHRLPIIFQGELDRKVANQLGLITGQQFVINNFIRPGADPGPVTGRAGWLLTGRSEPEKGFVELLEAWPREHDLVFVGDTTGLPLPPNTTVHDYMTNQELRSLMCRCIGVVIPSRWYESGYPRLALEAIAAGTPIVAREGNAAAALVHQYDVGSTYNSDIPEVIRGALDVLTDRGPIQNEKCRSIADQHFGVERWQREIRLAYESIMR